jgi:hypothetical protein
MLLVGRWSHLELLNRSCSGSRNSFKAVFRIRISIGFSLEWRLDRGEKRKNEGKKYLKQ